MKKKEINPFFSENKFKQERLKNFNSLVIGNLH